MRQIIANVFILFRVKYFHSQIVPVLSDFMFGTLGHDINSLARVKQTQTYSNSNNKNTQITRDLYSLYYFYDK